MTLIRTMTLDDLPLGMHLKTQAGWNQTQDDWRRFLTLSPDGCFVAECDGRGVGTVAVFVFGNVAWIAMVLVDASMRGRGLGTALMQHALTFTDARGIASVRLDATPLGKPIYEKLGFVTQFELARYAGEVAVDALPELSESVAIRRADTPDMPAIIALDAAATATPRERLLEALRAQQPDEVCLAVQNGQIVGYGMTRPGANAAQIGPIIGDEAAGAVLLNHALRQHVGRRVFVDVPDEQVAAVSLVRAAGLSVQRPLTRMCRGATVPERVARLWASSGPEKG